MIIFKTYGVNAAIEDRYCQSGLNTQSDRRPGESNFTYHGPGALKQNDTENNRINTNKKRAGVAILLSDKLDTGQIKYERQTGIRYHNGKVKP